MSLLCGAQHVVSHDGTHEACCEVPGVAYNFTTYHTRISISKVLAMSDASVFSEASDSLNTCLPSKRVLPQYVIPSVYVSQVLPHIVIRACMLLVQHGIDCTYVLLVQCGIDCSCVSQVLQRAIQTMELHPGATFCTLGSGTGKVRV